MSERTGEALAGLEVREPVPGEDARDSNDEIVAVGRHHSGPHAILAAAEAQVMHARSKCAGLQPRWSLLRDRFPRGRSLGIMRHGVPACTIQRGLLKISRRL